MENTQTIEYFKYVSLDHLATSLQQFVSHYQIHVLGTSKQNLMFEEIAEQIDRLLWVIDVALENEMDDVEPPVLNRVQFIDKKVGQQDNKMIFNSYRKSRKINQEIRFGLEVRVKDQLYGYEIEMGRFQKGKLNGFGHQLIVDDGQVIVATEGIFDGKNGSPAGLLRGSNCFDIEEAFFSDRSQGFRYELLQHEVRYRVPLVPDAIVPFRETKQMWTEQSLAKEQNPHQKQF